MSGLEVKQSMNISSGFKDFAVVKPSNGQMDLAITGWNSCLLCWTELFGSDVIIVLQDNDWFSL